MGKVSLKKNASSMHVIKTLQVLLQGNFSMNELIEKLNFDESEPIFNNSTISKYINTCRYCGIDIPKIHNKYFVASMPFGLELTMSDIYLLENLQNIIKEEMSRKCHKIFDRFIEKLNRYSNKKIARVEKDSYKINAELFEGAIRDKRKVRFMYKNRNIIDCIPVKITQNKSKTFFHVIHDDMEKMVLPERVSGMEILSEKFIPTFNEQSVVFVLKDALAKKYTLRENELLSNSSPYGTITVSNRGEAKELLLSRLLRYGDNCEIIYPKSYREEMKQILDDALSNYGAV